MPVRLTSQSESNPSRAWRWSLETTASGTYLPDPTTRSPIRDRHGGRTLGRSWLIGRPWGGRAPGTEGDYRKEPGRFRRLPPAARESHIAVTDDPPMPEIGPAGKPNRPITRRSA